ncbi:MAG TPA: hypothetical protein VNC39_07460 [Acidocella sp.]|jgi:anti-sigma factor RsiW|uniref:anti-sigma factor family protein n=1 Tax=Acidocella sp. TaxID=50710 RepID=UPI002C9BE1B1|nr:hypothetical protein [Acidocella sp.]HVE21796.1 hypothetical protein [Acidocella sp.]
MATLSDAMSSDAALVAFLDGELSRGDCRRVEAMLAENPVLAARLKFLTHGKMPFRDAFDGLLDEAPMSRLTAFIPERGQTAQTALPPPSPPQRHWEQGRRYALGVLTAAAACMVLGVLGDRGYLAWQAGAQRSDADKWRASVANYMRLYSPATFEQPMANAQSRMAQLEHVSSALGLALTPVTIAMPGIPFQRAELLRYQGMPLVQLDYLDPEYGPVALCLLRGRFGAAPLKTERRLGMNIAYWSTPLFSFLVIGRNPVSQLRAISQRLHVAIGA